jgi:hypothetical protein
VTLDSLARSRPELDPSVLVHSQECQPALGQSIWISRWDDDTGLADNRSAITHIGHYARNSARHRFADDVWKTLCVR